MSPLEHSTASDRTPAPPSSRLRTWLIVITILSAFGLLVSIPAAFFGTYMAAFAADDPSASPDAVWNFMVVVWGIAAGYIALIAAGVVGSWIAYRKRRSRLSFGLSLLAAVPIALVILAVVGVVLTNIIWSAIILRG